MKTITQAGCFLLASAFAVAACALPVRAQNESGGAPGEWLSQYTSARTLGLGGAFVAAADDPLGALWNPAGLSVMDQNRLSFETARLFEETSINAFSFTVPGHWLPTIGLSMLTLGSGEFERTNELNDALGTFRESETAYLVTMSKALNPRFSLGVNMKLVRQSIEEYSGGGFGFDAGVLYDVASNLRVGASLLNVGGPTINLRAVDETYPAEWRGGFSFTTFGGRGLVTGQIDHREGPGLGFHGGAEYWLQPAIAFRVGFDDQHGTGGLSFRFTPQYQVDYAVADHPLGMTHRVGLSYRFGGFFASSMAEPRVFSPTGERAVTKISLNARTKAEPREWALTIVDKGDQIVRRFGGAGQPPAHLLWDGKDETGLPLPDGVYRYTLTVRDREGREFTSPTHEVEIATEGPRGSVPVIPLGEVKKEGGSW